MKKIISIFISIIMILTLFSTSIYASNSEETEDNEGNNKAEDSVLSNLNVDINADSAVLMDYETGTLLYAKNANEALPPASVTKVMTLLLVAEAIKEGRISLDQEVTISSNASSMGGSQVFLKEGEAFTVEELLKSTVIASANDAAVALAELVSGSEQSFVNDMNKRAKELGMTNTVFENATGLDDTTVNHKTSAYDIAIMSRELLKHQCVLNYSNVWQDSIRNGEFILTNTNRLVRYYKGCTGLKTGSTDKAGFCISATAEREGMHLIAVIMGAETRDIRNNCARTLLDYGFANYAVYSDPEAELEKIDVSKGIVSDTSIYSNGFTKLVEKKTLNNIEKKYIIPENITAPLPANSKIGEIIYYNGEDEIGKADIVIKEEIKEVSILDLFILILNKIFVG